MKLRFLCLGLLVCLVLTGCADRFSWETSVAGDIALLQENGYTVYIADTPADRQSAADSLNSELSQGGQNFTVSLVHICYMSDGMEKIVAFEAFQTPQQAQKVYEWYLARADRPYRVFLAESVVVLTNHSRAMELLSYDFR